MSIDADRAELKLVRDHRADILKTGKSYSTAGSHDLTYADMADLDKRESLLRRRILRQKGYTGRVA